MKIIVCIKQINFLYFHYGVDAKSSHVDSEKMVSMINPFDEIAVEEAIRIKEKLNNVEVTLITLGPESSEPFLRYAFAFGADRMVRVDCECIDPWETAMALSGVLKKMEYDMILCGEKSLDKNNQLVGTFIAEKLDLPEVSGIVDLKVREHSRNAVVERKIGKGDREVIECSLPALFTVAAGLNDPRYPTLPSRLHAQKAPIQKIALHKMNDQTVKLIGQCKGIYLSPLKPKPKSIFTPDTSLPAYKRMQQVIMGDPTEKKGILLEGTPQNIAKKLKTILSQHNYLMNDNATASGEGVSESNLD